MKKDVAESKPRDRDIPVAAQVKDFPLITLGKTISMPDRALTKMKDLDEVLSCSGARD